MEWPFHDGNVHNLLENRHTNIGHDVSRSLQIHSSLVRRLSMEQELEGHQGCVNAVAWNSNGSLLISGSDDERINVWSYSGRKLLHSVETGHSANIFCTKFIPETSDELVVSGAGDAEVRLFNLSRLNGTGLNGGSITPSALYRCHTRRVKKLAGGSSLHLTHVTFSPNGEEVLLSYSGEHVYLMDINHGSGSLMQYTSGDASKLMTITPVLNKLEHQPPLSTIFQNGLRSRSNTAATLGRHNEALDFAVEAQCLSPYDTMAANKVENVKKHLAAGQFYHDLFILPLLEDCFGCHEYMMSSAPYVSSLLNCIV